MFSMAGVPEHRPVEAGRGGVVEVPVGVGPGQGAHAEPAEILHAPCAGHLVTAIQFLEEKQEMVVAEPQGGRPRSLSANSPQKHSSQ